MVNGVSSDELKELWGWLFKTLQSDDTPVDRSGAAQGIAYVLKAQVSSLNHTYFKPHLLGIGAIASVHASFCPVSTRLKGINQFT